MTEDQPAEAVKLVVAALCSSPQALKNSLGKLQACRGEIDYRGPAHPFNLTDYYREEMGEELERTIISFQLPACPVELIELKHECVELERALADEAGRRTANLDAGYLDHGKLVLASLKPAGQKIYLGRGVYADLVARYGGGKYQPFEWTFPDFTSGIYDEDLALIRQRYLEQLRSEPSPGING